MDAKEINVFVLFTSEWIVHIPSITISSLLCNNGLGAADKNRLKAERALSL